MLQSDRGTLRCCHASFPCTLCVSVARLPSTLSLVPRLHRLPTDPDLFANIKLKNQLANIIPVCGSYPDKFNDDLSKKILKRTRTGSLNEGILRIPDVEITSADYISIDGLFVNDIDTTLLTAKPCLDPYTPESIDSHTPNIEGISTGSEDLAAEVSDVLGETIIDKSSPYKLSRDRSVSPTQLKSRLDMLLNSEKECKPFLNTKEVPELQRLNSRESCRSSNKGGGLCCLALKCYGFCRRRASKVDCSSCCNCTS